MSTETTPPPTPTPPPLANSPEARTPDGTLRDQSATPPTPPDSSTTPPKDTTTPPKDPATPPPTEGAPETYADFTAPEGFEIDKDAIGKVLPVFKELNLSQAQAQKLVDQYAAISAEAAEAPVKFYAEMQKDWAKEAATRFGKDIEPGGAIVTELATALDNALPPTLAKNFRAVLDFTGAGNHPDFIEAMRIIAKPFLTGTHVRGANPSPKGQEAPGAPAKTAAQRMYPHLPSANG